MNTQIPLVGRRINMAPRAHRRRLVVMMYLIFAVLIVVWFSQPAASLVAGCMIAAFALLLLILHLVGRPSEATDERERHRWDHASARAYPWLGYVLVFAMFTSQVHRKVNAAIHPALHDALQLLPYGILMAAGVLYVTLPQAILLWTEPDLDSAGPRTASTKEKIA